MDIPDPITPLTPVEQAFVAWLDANSSRDEVLAELKDNLQTAIEIELATIPIYLYAYYSLVRNKESGETISDAQLYANKAGGMIMSVAVEEMLHMSLSSNILYAMGVPPRLYGMAPAQYPTGLPYHNPKGPPGPDGSTAVLIPLARLSFEQLWHFLQIEYPEQWDALPQDRDWDTIGQFYSYLRCLLRTQFVTDADFQAGAPATAIQPDNYSPNNIDTVYPDAGFDPWQPAPPAPKPGWADDDQSAAAAAVYTDTGDSHAGPTELITISSLSDAAEAIDTICDQGEGCPVPDVGPSPDDDPSKDEDSHYVKFLNLQAQYAAYAGCSEQLPPEPPPPAPITPAVDDAALFAAGVLVDVPDNPAGTDYPDLYREIADFNSALFQYMLIMCETLYRVPAADQKLFFNEGLHRSMIWVMDKYIRTIRQIPIPGGVHQGRMMGPLFENVDLGKPIDSFVGLTKYGNAAIAAANVLIGQLQGNEAAEDVMETVDALLHADEKPQQLKVEQDGDLIGILQNVIYYIGVALTKTGTGGASMHLPDVGPWWSNAQ